MQVLTWSKARFAWCIGIQFIGIGKDASTTITAIVVPIVVTSKEEKVKYYTNHCVGVAPHLAW